MERVASTPLRTLQIAVYCVVCRTEMVGDIWPSHYRTREHRRNAGAVLRAERAARNVGATSTVEQALRQDLLWAMNVIGHLAYPGSVAELFETYHLPSLGAQYEFVRDRWWPDADRTDPSPRQ